MNMEAVNSFLKDALKCPTPSFYPITLTSAFSIPLYVLYYIHPGVFLRLNNSISHGGRLNCTLSFKMYPISLVCNPTLNKLKNLFIFNVKYLD